MAGSLEINLDFARWYTQTFMEEGPINSGDKVYH
jgi:hypothetical protein